jgi:hypothetical protein
MLTWQREPGSRYRGADWKKGGPSENRKILLEQEPSRAEFQIPHCALFRRE